MLACLGRVLHALAEFWLAHGRLGMPLAEFWHALACLGRVLACPWAPWHAFGLPWPCLGMPLACPWACLGRVLACLGLPWPSFGMPWPGHGRALAWPCATLGQSTRVVVQETKSLDELRMRHEGEALVSRTLNLHFFAWHPTLPGHGRSTPTPPLYMHSEQLA